jgi:hypothetical protein
MKATAVEHEVESAIGRRLGEKVRYGEAATENAALHPGLRSFDRERRNIDSEYIETVLRHPNCVGAGTRSDLKRWTWRSPARIHKLDKQRLRVDLL